MGVHKYVYVVSAPGGPFAFLPHPAAKGLWIRTHPCVLVATCSVCEAAIGSPCHGRGGEVHSATHWVRRRDAKDQLETLMISPTIVASKAVAKKS